LGDSKKHPLSKREIALLAALLLLICYVLTRSPVHVTEEHYNRITWGMSPEEVSAMVGGPPGDYRTGPTHKPADSTGGIQQWWRSGQPDIQYWRTDTGWLVVHFGDEGAAQKSFERWERVPQTPINNLLWRWDRWRHAGQKVRE
jgi:hypothetical protein